MTQLSLFGENAMPVEQEHIDKLREFTEGERTWLKGLSTELRPAAIAFLHWKSTEPNHDKLTRPFLWMVAFTYGVKVGSAMSGGELGNATDEADRG